jgi:demethylmenaquinone methyltransferase/2-methoxy-6-polyprenyl-1,4-benzoquinol methylase
VTPASKPHSAAPQDGEAARVATRAGGAPSSPRKRHARALFAAIPGDYDRAGALLSAGQDPRWRRALVEAVRAASADRVLDVATGTGLVASALVRRWGCRVVGLDQSPEMLARARARVERDGDLQGRISLVQGEAEALPFADAEVDHLTFTYLLRYVDDPAATLAELARVVRPGGRVAMLEFGVPSHPLLRLGWQAYARAGLPALGRLFSAEWAATGRFLADSIPEFYARIPLERHVDMWRAAGIDDVQVRRMSLGAGVVMWGTRAARPASAPSAGAGDGNATRA